MDTYDVVVVGSGAGALVGAWTATTLGLRTVVLEKTDLCGGTSAYSGGGMFLPGNHLTLEAGLPDSVDRARTFLGAVLGGVDARVEAYLTTGPELVTKLAEVVRLERTPFPEYYEAPGRLATGGQLQPVPLPVDEVKPDVLALVRPGISIDRWATPLPRDPLWGGQALIAQLLQAILDNGGEVRTGCGVDELVLEDSRVVGVRGTFGEVRARRGVLLGAGGFERSAELRARFGVPGSAHDTMAPQGTNDGAALLAAMAVGAATDLLNEAWFCPALVEPDGTAGFVLGASGGLVVDPTGKRFANESLPYDRFGREMAAHARTAWFVFTGTRLPAVRCVPGPRREDYLAAGAWVQADTVEELAALLDTPDLVPTVERFNDFATSGVDEDFHRGEDEFDLFWAKAAGPNPCLVPLVDGPFFAAKLVLGDLGTKGGLVTDADANVLRADGSPIPGLYATGNTMASVTGAHYPASGSPIGTAAVFGYRAVRHLAQLPST